MAISTHPDDLLANMLALQADVTVLKDQLAGAQSPLGWDFEYFQAKQASFQHPPLEFSVAHTTQGTSVASNTTTPINFSSLDNPRVQRFGETFIWSSNNRDRFYYPHITAEQGRWNLVTIHGIWDGSSGNHYMDLRLISYRSDDTPIGQAIVNTEPTSVNPMSLFVFPYRFNSSFHYFNIVAQQLSASSVKLNTLRISALRLT